MRLLYRVYWLQRTYLGFSSGGARNREQIMMYFFRRDITLWLGFIFLLYVTTQVPTCVLAGLGSSRPSKPVVHLAPPPRDTRPKSQYPPLRIPREIQGNQGIDGRPPAPPPGPQRRPPPVSVPWRPPTPPLGSKQNQGIEGRPPAPPPGPQRRQG
ncbi:hypothetical protein MTO96_039087 [Rhipicephalus appendiculatus]